MAIAKGVSKVVSYKKETTWGELAGATSGKQLRRVTANFNLAKDSFESNEIRTDRQIADFRHGVRSATGTINGELSPKTYSDFIQSLVARDFTAVTAIASLSLTIAASGSLFTVTRGAGSWLTDGINVGMVLRLTGSLNAANSAKNLLVVSMTALALTVRPLNSVALVAEGPIASCTATVVGKQTYVPATGHTDDSYTVEEWFSDIAQSEVYTGMKVNSVAVQLPATGLATVDMNFAGKDLTAKATTQYFTSPTAQGTEGLFAAVSGALVMNGTPVALVTSADFSIERATENATAIGSNSVAEIFTGRIRATGNMTVYFQDAVMRDFFDNETAISLVIALASDSTATSNFMSFTFPKVKLNNFDVADGELGQTGSVSFTALLNDVTSAGLAATTVQVQDSSVA